MAGNGGARRSDPVRSGQIRPSCRERPGRCPHPILHTQVSTARLLLLLVRQLLLRPAPGSGALPVSAGAVDALLVPAAPSLVPLACAFLHERVGAVDVALRLETVSYTHLTLPTKRIV